MRTLATVQSANLEDGGGKSRAADRQIQQEANIERNKNKNHYEGKKGYNKMIKG